MMQVIKELSNICPHCRKAMQPWEGTSNMTGNICTITCANCWREYFYDNGDGITMSEVTRAYLSAALWTSDGDDERPLESQYSLTDLTFETIINAEKVCTAFAAANADTIESAGLTQAQVGHDLWLTRNGHGAGFWDRDIGEAGTLLTTACEFLGEVYAIETGNGQVEIFG